MYIYRLRSLEMARFIVAPDFSPWLRAERASADIAFHSRGGETRVVGLGVTDFMPKLKVRQEDVHRFLDAVAHDVVLQPTQIEKGGTGDDDIPAAIAFEADPEEIRRKQPEIDGVLVKDSRPRWVEGLGPSGYVGMKASRAYVPNKAFPSAPRERIEVVVTGAGGAHPLQNATVTAFWHSPRGLSCDDVLSDDSGRAHLDVPAGLSIELEVSPLVDHWPMVTSVAAGTRSITIDCPRIEPSQKGFWWRDFVGASASRRGRGAGLRIGVVDTGVGPHPALEHVERVAVFGAGIVPGHGEAVDLRGHGTHVAGILGARAPAVDGWEGLAPDAELMSCRVFGPRGSADQRDTADAILHLARRGAHLINLSLSAPRSSAIERQYIQIARDLGTLCIAAAGNIGGQVRYPAAYTEVVGVGAIGRREEWLPSSPSAQRMPNVAADWGMGGVFGANFSCRGRQVFCVGPGVGVASTIANAVLGSHGHAVMDGTSMACPVVTGVLASALSQDAGYMALPPGPARVTRARRILRKLLTETGLSTSDWGNGVPRIV